MQDGKNFWRQALKNKDYLLAMGKSLSLIILLAFIFYSDFRAILFLLPLGGKICKFLLEEEVQKKKLLFEQQFQAALQSLAAQLNIGYSMENALIEMQKDLQMIYSKEELINKEFGFMVRQLKMNFTVEEIWQQFAERTQLESVKNFVMVIVLAKRNGGDSIQIIRNAVSHIQDQVEIRREIQTVTAAKRLEFQMMCVIPMGIIAYMRVCFADFMKVLYGNIFGIVFMTICLGIYLYAWKLGNRMIEIEV